MAERGDTRVESELLGEDLFDSVGVDGVELGVVRAFGYDDDGLALADGTLLIR